MADWNLQALGRRLARRLRACESLGHPDRELRDPKKKNVDKIL
jgi:hypothetical protein